MRSNSSLWFAGVAVLGLGLCATSARADSSPLSAAELARLDRGETVVREQTLTSEDDGDKKLVGGLAYAIVDAPADEVMGLLDDAAAYTQVLPKTKSARRLSGTSDDQRLEITQGNALVSASYVLHVRKYARENTIRFWLDPTYPHGVDDAWGFVRVEPITTASGAARTLVTYGALVDLGPGIVRALYEERLRAAMLTVPTLLRAYVARAIRPTLPPA